MLSDGLPSVCYNFHPSIALSARQYQDAKDVVDGGLGGQIPQVAGPNPINKLHDWVVWESRIKNKRWDSKFNFWPVMRKRTQYLDMPATPGFWSLFSVYQPKFDTTGFHWPNITAGSRSDAVLPGPVSTKTPFRELARIAWHDDSVDHLEFVHIRPISRRTYLLEDGRFPSLPLASYDVRRMTDSSKVQQSVVFAGLQIEGGLNQTRITNGWFPWIGTEFTPARFPGFRIAIPHGNTIICDGVSDWDEDIGNPSIISTPGGPTEIGWVTLDPQLGAFPHQWPVVPYIRVEYRSETFHLDPLDSVVVPRQADTVDLTAFRTGLYDSADYVMAKITLRKAVDSAWVATIDSAVITLGSVLYPGNGLHATLAKYEHPLGGITDTMFLAIEVLRGNASNSFIRGFMEYEVNDPVSTYAFKEASRREPQAAPKRESIKLDIRPNPTDYTAVASITVPAGAHLRVELFDVGGRKIMTILERESDTGMEKVTLDGTSLPAGSYFVRIQSGNEVVTKRLELIR